MESSKMNLDALDKAITRAHRIVSGLMIATLLIYLVWFWLIQSRVLSNQSDAWGQFGDFVGGVLNPLVAYSAFYWLTRSVRLQKEELLETRVALQESSASQSKQAVYAQISVRVSALTALINSIMAEVQTQRMQLQFIVDQPSFVSHGGGHLLDGTYKDRDEMIRHIAVLNNQISQRLTERYDYEQELKALLQENPVSAQPIIPADAPR